jgi:hypothetical protein
VVYSENEKRMAARVYKAFGEDKIRERSAYLHGLLELFIVKMGLRGYVYINPDLLHQVILDYFSDIYRLKAFEGIRKANLHKINAYEAYWILRRKPLQLRIQDGGVQSVFVNENFVAQMLCETFVPAVSPTQPRDNNDVFFRHLFYFLKYRPLEQRSLELALSALNVRYEAE